MSESEVERTVMPDYLLLMTGEVAKPPDLGAFAPHAFDAQKCFPTCARTWADGCARLLGTLDIWSAKSLLQETSVACLSIENVLIGLPFVA